MTLRRPMTEAAPVSIYLRDGASLRITAADAPEPDRWLPVDARAIVDALSDGFLVVDGDGRIREMNDRFCEMTGYEAAELLGTLPPHRYWPESGRERIGQALRTALASGTGRYELTWQRKDGAPLPVAINVSPLDGGQPGFLCVIRDETASRAAERAVHLQAHLLDAVHVAVIATDLHGTITHWNSGAEQTYGWTREEAIGHSINDFTVGPEDKATADGIMESIRATGRWEGEFPVRRKDGTTFPAFVRDALFTDADGHPAGVVGVSVDVSDRVRVARELELARNYLRTVTDSMGEGLYTIDTDGRLIYMNRAAEQMLGWRQDELVGRVMHHATHEVHADGSPYLLEDCPMFIARREGRVMRVEDEIFVRRDGSRLPVAYTTSPFETEDGVRGSVVVFSDVTERRAEEARLKQQVEEMTTVARVRDALAEDRLTLHAQPIVDVTTGATVQHELLIRMRERDGTLVAPGEFLPAAERHGQITAIDRWVVGQAIVLAARGKAVELNLSAHSIGSRALLEEFRGGLARSGADPSLIVVELTETALLCDEPAAEAFIGEIKALGCRFALDDFGTGYGGFTYLKRLPVDYLKIDVEFVRDLTANEASRHVVQAVVSLARGFGQRTVAEGVEDDETLALLSELGVDYAQGYAIARPQPVDDVLLTA
jgi:PAS domain S-box-containing protein